VDDLAPLLVGWPVERAAAGVTGPSATLAVGGDPAWQVRTASVSKLLVGLAALVALEEGAIDLDEPAGPEGSLVRHLLAHASGLAFDKDVTLTAPGQRRIYSNVGIERFAEHLATRTGIAFADYLRQAVTEPLGMGDTALLGSPANDVYSTVDDLLRFARELLHPRLVAPETLAMATTVHFPDLAGMVPGVGRFDPNPWGLTFELRDGKSPHWTGTRNSARTFGHFGGSGTFLWVDPEVELAGVALTVREFGPWALGAWPAFSDAVRQRYAVA
jgi:CubicO group peptidase (beta-lactamase class C family)